MIDRGLNCGGEGSQIGFAHRSKVALYAKLSLVTNALDFDRERDLTALYYPRAENGLHAMQIVYSMAASAQNRSQWVEL